MKKVFQLEINISTRSLSHTIPKWYNEIQMLNRSRSKEFDSFRKSTPEESFVFHRRDDLEPINMAISAMSPDSDDELRERSFQVLKKNVEDLIPKSFLDFFSKVSKANSVGDLDPKDLQEMEGLLESGIGRDKGIPLDIVRSSVRKWEHGEKSRTFDAMEDKKMQSVIPLLPKEWYEIFQQYSEGKMSDDDKADLVQKLYETKLITPPFELGSSLEESLNNFVNAIDKENRLINWPFVTKSFEYLKQIVQSHDIPSDKPQEITKKLLLTQIQIIEIAGMAYASSEPGFVIQHDIGVSSSLNWQATINSILQNIQSPHNTESSMNLEGVYRNPASPSGGETKAFLEVSTTKDDKILVYYGKFSPINHARLKTKLEKQGMQTERNADRLDKLKIIL
ncbi:MAG: hypothetical protein Q8Q30_02105 [Candidatus Woesebacteria bacterium]|nr:hypothetical protein [Candidatus Woesebacteria bacterium]